MPGWDSLDSVMRLHGDAQLAGLVLLALVAGLAGFAAWRLREGVWPEWLDIGQYQLRSRFFAIGGAAVLVLLAAAQLTAYAYGERQQALRAVAEQDNTERLSRLTAELQKHRADTTPNRVLKENTELRLKLVAAQNRVAELERAQSQKRLSQDQKRLLVDSLRPFAGQRISVASIRGDDDALVLARDFVSVFDDAGWSHDGEADLSARQWDRDPVGVEVMLNESDARGDRITAGIGALINAVRKLGLVYDNTIYMSDEVPAGEAQLRVGKKLRR
jgi:hypothetical protein